MSQKIKTNNYVVFTLSKNQMINIILPIKKLWWRYIYNITQPFLLSRGNIHTYMKENAETWQELSNILQPSPDVYQQNPFDALSQNFAYKPQN